MSDAQFQAVVLWLHKRHFSYQLHNITAFNPDGSPFSSNPPHPLLLI